MANVVVFGATGFAGGNILRELKKRGHEVTGVTRGGGEGLAAGDVTQADDVKHAIEGADVVVIAIRAAHDGGNPLVTAVQNVLASEADVRLGVVGGAGSLYTSEGGPRVIDLPSFPDVYKAEATAHGEALDYLRAVEAPLDWFYLSPTAAFGAHAPAIDDTGAYRTQKDTLVVGADGVSAISGADYALAFVDEIEKPNHHRMRFSVGL